MTQKQQFLPDVIVSLSKNASSGIQHSGEINKNIQESRLTKRNRVEELKNHVLNLAEHQMDSTVRILRRWMNEP